MKIKKQYIVISSISLVVLIVLAFSYLYLNKENKKVELSKTNIEVSDSFIPVSKVEPRIKIPVESIAVEKESIEENKKYIRVTLNVLSKDYYLSTEEGSSLYDAMKNIKDDTFSFNGVNHSGLGYFVNEINGLKGKSGLYWIYYINDKEASVGVSNYMLKDGDIISWKQE